jgi:hypothetical protein
MPLAPDGCNDSLGGVACGPAGSLLHYPRDDTCAGADAARKQADDLNKPHMIPHRQR